jgi:hypothetical protein
MFPPQGKLSVVAEASYIIEKIGDIIYAKNSKGQIEFSGNDATTVIQKAIDATNRAGGGKVFIRRGTYLITDTIWLKSYVELVGELSILLKRFLMDFPERPELFSSFQFS